jgi:hypothetical protein
MKYQNEMDYLAALPLDEAFELVLELMIVDSNTPTLNVAWLQNIVRQLTAYYDAVRSDDTFEFVLFTKSSEPIIKLSVAVDGLYFRGGTFKFDYRVQDVDVKKVFRTFKIKQLG